MVFYPPQGRPIKLNDDVKATFGTSQDSSIVDTGSVIILDYDEQNAGSKTFDIQSDTTSILKCEDTVVTITVPIEMTSNAITNIGDLNLADKTRIAISSGAVTMTQAYHSVDGESDTNDALDTLNGGTAGDIVVLRPDDDAATITVTDAGNIILAGDADFVMSDIADIITLLYDGTNWIELSRSLNHV